MKTHSFKESYYSDLFFDLDRTLWDLERNARETFMELYHKHQLNAIYGSFDTFLSIYKDYNDELWMLYRSGEIDKETLSWKRFDFTLKDMDVEDEVLAKKLSEDYLKILPTKKKLFPHTHTTLMYLKKQYNLHLITNGFTEVQYQKIINSGIRRYFNRIFTSEEIGVHKPNPEFFEHILNVTGANPEYSMVIGDDLQVDIQGAKNAKMSSVWFNKECLDIRKVGKGVKPTYEINSLKSLIHIL
jgi:putative hydrolase of the HAD superfamily